MKSFFIYIFTFISSFLLYSCGVEEIKDPRLEVAIISPKVNPTTARALVLKDQKFVYEARVRGGDDDSYKWSVNNEQIATTLRTDSISYSNEGFQIAKFEAGNNTYTGSAEITLYVVERAASFDDLTLNDNSYWVGNDMSGSSSTFTSGNISFNNVSPTSSDDYYEFGYSNITDSSVSEYGQYGAFLLLPSNNQFGVVRTYENGKLIMKFDGKYSPMSIDLANNGSVVQYAKGETGNNAFSNGDFYQIDIRGIRGDTVATDTVISTTLISRISNNLSVNNSWENQELISLGLVEGLEFTITTSKKDTANVITYPRRFCIDNLILLNDSGEISSLIND
ncbi:DUF4465 domain-containing protein [Flammeovirga pacifica]|uniref:DUF4465 domain-containing protein n=1 Tax=Flammeovirga pacifica TaxID=915059 RepID=A0A1S1Z1N9_FLAPC|nr:DUF4465 domain-containing protein [Flammeovirga pacifica]OHX67147.1 hypothetical protein NH26_12750 [Flammeovirga pacifica]